MMPTTTKSSVLKAEFSAESNLPLKTQIAFMRRKMAEQGIMGKEEPSLKRVIPLRELKLD